MVPRACPSWYNRGMWGRWAFRGASIALWLACTAGCGVGCDDGPHVPDRPPAPPLQDVSLFSDAYQFQCSPDRQVGCDGVFAIRRQAGDFPTHVAVLKNGDEAFRARLQLIHSAKRSIRMQALIFRGDDSGLFISQALKRKAAEGVDVRVIVDALSNLDSDTQWMYFDLKQHGIEVEGYETLYLNWIAADWKIGDPLRGNKRFHDKMLIIDAEDLPQARAIVGGLNVANEYFRIDPTPLNRWRDQDVALKGSVIKDVTRGFDRNYDYLKGLKERLPKIFNPDNSWKLTRAVLDRISRLQFDEVRDPKLKASIVETLKTPAKLTWRAVNARFLQSRPRFRESYISQAYLHLIRTAQNSIDIANAYFVPSRDLLDALKDAARRGVHVRILTNSPITNDIAPVATISRHLYQELLDVNREPAMQPQVGRGRGLEIYEWIGPDVGEGTLHAKFALFDDHSAIVGSYNLDPRSEALNSETAIALEDEGTVRALRTQFVLDDLKKSHLVTPAEAARYRNPKNLGKQFDLLFSLPLKNWL